MATLPCLIAEMWGPGPPQPLLQSASLQERVTKVTLCATICNMFNFVMGEDINTDSLFIGTVLIPAGVCGMVHFIPSV